MVGADLLDSLGDERGETADVIICATGYEMSFPFFDEDDVDRVEHVVQQLAVQPVP